MMMKNVASKSNLALEQITILDFQLEPDQTGANFGPLYLDWETIIPFYFTCTPRFSDLSTSLKTAFLHDDKDESKVI